MVVVVHVKPRARRESVEKGADGALVVRLSAPPVDGKANTRLLQILAEHFKVPRSSLEIVSGERARKKLIWVPDHPGKP